MKRNNCRLISFQIIAYNVEAIFLIFISRLMGFSNLLLQDIKNFKKSLLRGGSSARNVSHGSVVGVRLSPKASRTDCRPDNEPKMLLKAR
ncbi:hypothetical protein H6F74_03775 [Trichocoleus sp. FACHB-90]|uniref:hypothetical protein n=1 Tax=Cyanophyceae TaxID=3028117 RepID=UPI0016890D7C|nr:hypothetical protein [Trichocoleus sp. FACHB-90]MBD1925408.1 hypothetical protein [Trichocoleus sp. FACHB-90]